MRTLAIALLILFAACDKDSDSGPPIPETGTAPINDRMVDVIECSPNTHKDVYIGNSEANLPELTHAGQTVTVAMWGTPYQANGVTTWSVACVQVKVGNAIVATFQATAPEQFTYVIQ